MDNTRPAVHPLPTPPLSITPAFFTGAVFGRILASQHIGWTCFKNHDADAVGKPGNISLSGLSLANASNNKNGVQISIHARQLSV